MSANPLSPEQQKSYDQLVGEYLLDDAGILRILQGYLVSGESIGDIRQRLDGGGLNQTANMVRSARRGIGFIIPNPIVDPLE